VLVLAVEVVGRGRVLPVHEVEITGVARQAVHFDEDGRRHEKRVAPAPALLVVLLGEVERAFVRVGEDVVVRQLKPCGIRRVVIERRDFQPALPDAVVVGVVGSRERLPGAFAAEVADLVQIRQCRIGEAERGNTRVKRAVCPIQLTVAFRVGGHPVRHEPRVGVHGFQRPGVGNPALRLRMQREACAKNSEEYRESIQIHAGSLRCDVFKSRQIQRTMESSVRGFPADSSAKLFFASFICEHRKMQ